MPGTYSPDLTLWEDIAVNFSLKEAYVSVYSAIKEKLTSLLDGHLQCTYSVISGNKAM